MKNLENLLRSPHLSKETKILLIGDIIAMRIPNDNINSSFLKFLNTNSDAPFFMDNFYSITRYCFFFDDQCILENKIHDTLSRKIADKNWDSICPDIFRFVKRKQTMARLLLTSIVSSNENKNKGLIIKSLSILTGKDCGTDLDAWKKAVEAMPEGGKSVTGDR